MAGDVEIEWIDAEPPRGPGGAGGSGGSTSPTGSAEPGDAIESRPARVRPTWFDSRWLRSSRLRWTYAIAALAIVAAVVVAIRPHPVKTAPVAITPTPTVAHASSPSEADPTAGAGAPPVVTLVGHPLLKVPATWDLFGRGSGSVMRLQLAAGRMTLTPIPLLSSTGPASFVVGPDRAIVRPLAVNLGVQVRDGQPAEVLATDSSQIAPVLPGPDPKHLWVAGPDSSTMTLIDFDGRPTKTVVLLPTGDTTISSDGAGYLLFSDIGGVYDARPSGVKRITAGALLAVGPKTWLTLECDNGFNCVTTVIDRATGAHHALPETFDAHAQLGTISPDGRTAAMFESDDAVPDSRLHLIDLATGVDRPTTLLLDPNLNYQTGLVVWSPDSAWLFSTNALGRLYALNPHTNQVTDLDVTAGPISQLALRVAPG